MEKLKSNLALFFTGLSLQITITHFGLYKSFDGVALITPILYLALAYKLLVENLKGTSLKDYFGIKGRDIERDQHKELLIQGEIIESDLEEDYKEERFMRVAGLSHNMRRRLNLVILLAFTISFQIVLKKSGINFEYRPHLIPFGVAVLTLLSASYGQLMALPFITLIAGVLTSGPLNNQSLFFLGGSLWAGLSLIRLLKTIARRKEESQFKLFIHLLIEVKNTVMPIMAFAIIFQFLIPQEEIKRNQTPKEEPLQKINRELGKVVKKPSQRKVNQRNHLKNLSLQKGFEGFNLQKSLKDLGKAMDFYKDVLNPDFLKSLPIPHMEQNYLTNSYKELYKEHQKIQSVLQGKGTYSKEDVEAVFDFFNKLEDLNREMAKYKSLNEALPSPPAEIGSKSLNSALKETYKASIAPLEDVAAIPQIKVDLPEGDKLPEFFKYENEIEKFDIIREKARQNLIKEEESEKNLISPELLKKWTERIKLAIGVILGLLVLNFISQLFSKKKILSSDDEASRQVKRRLLKSKKYQSVSQEIQERYNLFLNAVKVIHFPDENEPPPPKVLEAYLLDKSAKNKKALVYLTEIFSHSFYGSKDFSSKALKKYRKAYRVVVKSL